MAGLWLDSNAIHTIENISHLKCETDPNPNPTTCEKFAALRYVLVPIGNSNFCT